jgi:TrmH family RNA methyltransferase
MLTGAEKPTVKQARALHERRARRKQGHCLAEGVRLVEDAMRAGTVPALVFYAELAHLSARALALLAALGTAHVPRRPHHRW